MIVISYVSREARFALGVVKILCSGIWRAILLPVIERVAIACVCLAIVLGLILTYAPLFGF